MLEQMSRQMGLQQVDSTQRSLMLKFLNPAAKELYHISDMSGCLGEELFKVNSNQTIAFPDYIGQIRAMRDGYNRTQIKLSQMRPLYNQYSWEQAWRNWRVKGLHPLQTSLQNQSQLIISVQAVENPPIVINITGSTLVSSSISESITMTSTTINTQNAYTDVKSFTKNSINQYNVTLSDINNNPISYIANNKLQALFQIIDISLMPWNSYLDNPLLGWVEVLFKKALSQFENDTDEFPAPGYDDVIINKALQLYFEQQQNIPVAAAYYQKANQMLAQIHEDANRGTDDVISLVENPHDKINPRVGWGRDYRYSWRVTGR
jgi:hypothetical protein